MKGTSTYRIYTLTIKLYIHHKRHHERLGFLKNGDRFKAPVTYILSTSFRIAAVTFCCPKETCFTYTLCESMQSKRLDWFW